MSGNVNPKREPLEILNATLSVVNALNRKRDVDYKHLNKVLREGLAELKEVWEDEECTSM
jgi:hypothetical protein